MMLRTVSTSTNSNSTASGSIVGSESAIVDIVTQLGATFTKLIELMLSKEIKVGVQLFSVSGLPLLRMPLILYVLYQTFVL